MTLFRGFKVSSWWGVFSPGAPGFPYVFQMPNNPVGPPLILLSGDCTGSAYIFAPKPPATHAKHSAASKDLAEDPKNDDATLVVGEIVAAAVDTASSGVNVSAARRSPLPTYEMSFEIQCGATVGSAAVAASLDGSGAVDIFIPSYELNKIHKFRLSHSHPGVSKQDEPSDGDGEG